MTVTPVPYVFTQFGLDSGALTILGSVIHQFNEPGEYRGAALLPNAPAVPFYLTVDGASAANQVHIDLAASPPATPSACSCGKSHDGPSVGHFVLGAKGYAVFHVSGGAGGYAVRVVGAGKSQEEFDSTALAKGDLFAATILRPGRYSVTNLHHAQATTATIDVAYPKVGRVPYQPAPPVHVSCAASGFSTAAIAMTAAQACVFSCKASSRLKIELVTPFDPPPADRPTRGRASRHPR
jgi:hypothetical protein